MYVMNFGWVYFEVLLVRAFRMVVKKHDFEWTIEE